MQRCLLVAQAVRLLDPSCPTGQDKTSILGLKPQQVEELMPSEKVGLENLYGVQCECDRQVGDWTWFVMLEMSSRKVKMYLCLSLPCQWWGVYLNQNVQRMKQSLPRELEKHLKKKCLSLLSYYQPECGIVDKELDTDPFLCAGVRTKMLLYFFFSL